MIPQPRHGGQEIRRGGVTLGHGMKKTGEAQILVGLFMLEELFDFDEESVAESVKARERLGSFGGATFRIEGENLCSAGV